MRLLHTSDWHLGRAFHGTPLLDQQRAAVDAMVEIVRSERVDVVLIAGDVYDRQIPSGETTELLEQALCRLRAAGAIVVAIAGNHDSGVRLGFLEPVMAAGGVSIRGDIRTAGAPVLVPAADGGSGLAIYPIPYLDPDVARHRLDAPEARTHDSLLRVALNRARVDLATRPGARSVAMAHAYVAGGQACDSERALTVGGSAEVGLGCFSAFDYVALGHLHGRQTFGSGRIRYSGSPLAYSFSERTHTKGVWLVDLPPDGSGAVCQAIDLPVPRPLAVVEGDLDVLLSSRRFAGVESCWVEAVLTDMVLPPEAMARVRARFRYAVKLVHRPPAGTLTAAATGYGDRVRGRTDLELTLGFLAHVTGTSPDAQDQADLAAALDSVLATEALA